MGCYIYIYRAKEREAGREGGRERDRERERARAGKLESETAKERERVRERNECECERENLSVDGLSAASVASLEKPPTISPFCSPLGVVLVWWSRQNLLRLSICRLGLRVECRFESVRLALGGPACKCVSRITAAPDFALLGLRMLPGAGDSGCKQNKSQKVQSNSDGVLGAYSATYT